MSSNPEMIRRLRLGDLQKFLRWRYGPNLPDDDAGRDDLHELLLPISLGPEASQKIENAIAIWAPWMDADERLPLIDRINRTPLYLRKPNARTLGQRLCLMNQERERLGIRTIAPIDMTDEQLQERRKVRKRARERQRRRQAGSSLRETSFARLKPWETEGKSRATWFRERARNHETNSCPIKLLNSKHETVSPINLESQKRGLPMKEGQEKEREGKKRARA